ncbi:MAG: redoxin family protein [Candidatus Paceibacterota bacterium]
MNRKNSILGLVVIVIVGAIVYINHKKPSINTNAPDVMIAPLDTNTTPGVMAQDRTTVLAAKAKKYPKAKELVAPSGFVNSDPFKLADVVGKKVILIDFWTYSCINCQRTIPYLNTWYDKYEKNGLVIIGVHTPEFDFEKNYDNVKAAVVKVGIKYPVVLDSDMGTWNAYGNQYWPREYLIDIDGYVVHDHIGEGGYNETEKAIQAALAERAQVLGTKDAVPTTTSIPANTISLNQGAVKSPETYFGAARNEYLATGTQRRVGVQVLTIPATIQDNELYLDGTWNFQDQYTENTTVNAHIQYKYNAKHVYFVASAKNPVTIKITQDGKPLGAAAGKDVNADGTVTIKENRLYDLINNADYGAHTVQIEVVNAGLDAYTFTFG